MSGMIGVPSVAISKELETLMMEWRSSHERGVFQTEHVIELEPVRLRMTR